jgi:large subunit ribosomal protein L10
MPSNKILEEKKQVVETLAAKMQSAQAGVLVKYEGITVADDTALRAALRKAGIEYSVMKNTLTGRACDMCGYSDIKQYLNGMTAIAISQNDPVAPAKIIKEYADKIESFNILAGYVDGEVIDAAGVQNLAEIPSKEILLAKFLGSIKSPLYNFAYAIQAIIDKDGEDAPAAEEAAVEAPAAE